MSEATDSASTVARDRVVEFHYDLHDESGALLESSRGGTPVSVLHGHGNVVAGVERALAGRAAGERFSVTVPPGDGYGERHPERTRRVSKKYLADAPKRLRPGMQVALSTEHGLRPVRVLKVGGSVVDVDLNHPMAGMTLRFEIEVLSVRAAEPEEIVHGHVHGPGGHHH